MMLLKDDDDSIRSRHTRIQSVVSRVQVLEDLLHQYRIFVGKCQASV